MQFSWRWIRRAYFITNAVRVKYYHLFVSHSACTNIYIFFFVIYLYYKFPTVFIVIWNNLKINVESLTDQYIIHAKLVSVDISYIFSVVSVESVDTILMIFFPRCNSKIKKRTYFDNWSFLMVSSILTNINFSIIKN